MCLIMTATPDLMNLRRYVTGYEKIPSGQGVNISLVRVHINRADEYSILEDYKRNR